MVILLLRPVHLLRRQWQAPATVAAMLALGLVVWIGFAAVERRVETIWSGQALQESRMPVWKDAWAVGREFPLFGTGYGTYRYAERLHHEQAASIFYHEHAHSEILEAMLEGGVVRLGLTLLGIGLVFWYGWQAVRRYADRPEAGLALGALFGFTTLVIHSIADFGMHMPAIALLATVLCATGVAGPDAARGRAKSRRWCRRGPRQCRNVRCIRLSPRWRRRRWPGR